MRRHRLITYNKCIINLRRFIVYMLHARSRPFNVRREKSADGERWGLKHLFTYSLKAVVLNRGDISP